MTDPAALLGTWKMVSWQREVVATGERLDALGPEPVGYINYGPDGRMFAFVLSRDRPAPATAVPTDEEKLRLFNSMLAYAGTYTVHAEKLFITSMRHGTRPGPGPIKHGSTGWTARPSH